MTFESHALVAQSDEVLYLESEGGRVSEYLRSCGIRATNLADWYAEGRERHEVYRRVADQLIARASGGSKVCYLAPGNPYFLNSICTIVEAACHEKHIGFRLLSGVSSLDTLITDLRLPVGETGLQCYLAHTFCELKPIIDTSVPLVLFQPGMVNADTVRFRKPPSGEDLRVLRQCLETLYQCDTKWLLVSSASKANEAPLVVTNTISRLEEFAGVMLLGTLVVPGRWWPEWIALDTGLDETWGG